MDNIIKDTNWTILDKITKQAMNQSLPDELVANWDDSIIKSYEKGVENFIDAYNHQQLYPSGDWLYEKIDINQQLLIHNYTGSCPTLTYEISPVKGCHIGCLYCLVNDGKHHEPLVVYDNYHELVRKFLETNHTEEHYYYFSAKTEAFQRPTLETGIAHKILKVFIEHYKSFPASKARLFIASKAGYDTLMSSYEGETIFDLFLKLKGKMQFNTSISIMPEAVRRLLEPEAPTIEQRLKAVEKCRSLGVMANSALIQPILPFMINDDYLDNYFEKLSEVGIINYKPEFLTACIENIALCGKIVGYYNKDQEKELYQCYFTKDNLSHVKQRQRIAPINSISKSLLEQIMKVSTRYDITTSICYWVRTELGISEKDIPFINSNGFQCLGYQSQLFQK